MSLKPTDVNFSEVWEGRLLDTVRSVVTCYAIVKSTWNDRFNDVYKLCVAHPESNASRLYHETKTFLETHVSALAEEVMASNETNMLNLYYKYWTIYQKGASYLNHLYGYLNVQFIRKQKLSEADINYGDFLEDSSHQMLEVGELSLEIWKTLMITPMLDQLIKLLLRQIQLDRNYGNVNQSVIQGVMCSFVQVEEYKAKNPLQFYEDTIERAYIQATGDFFRQEALKLKDELTCSLYMQKIISYIDSENLRSRKFLHPSSYKKISRECDQCMVGDHLPFLHGECEKMIQLEIYPDLKNMYKILKPINGALDVMSHCLRRHIESLASKAILALKGENIVSQFVESLLSIHQHFSQLITDVFQSDQLFFSALDRALSAVINQKQSAKSLCQSPEILARYCDSLLKKSAKGLSESDQDELLSKSITIFKYLDDKDIFQRVYARLLTRRLIQGVSSSMDSEESMINKLKQVCGYEFTSKLHRMFTDMAISADLQNKFSTYLKDTSVGINFSILVLQAGAWPLSQSNPSGFVVPQELEKFIHTFDNFYSQSFSGRKLAWLYHVSNGELKLNYLTHPYFVTVTTYHMSILLLYNAYTEICLSDIQKLTQFDHPELIKQINSLIDAKLLQADSELNSKTVVRLNLKFSSKRTKFKVTTTIQRESMQEVETSQAMIDDDRKMYIQAAIVRIMKARKSLKHTYLIDEVIKQLKNHFAPSVPMIKKCIEILIDKQYLERGSKSTDQYNYIA